MVLLVLLTVSEPSHAQPVRYRGQYTLAHEVNAFCPAVNSQCYWLNDDTPDGVREALRQLVRLDTSEPYESGCVVVEGEIDRGSPRGGFAADYDGFVMITTVYGPCAKTQIVTQGDLQHHRWVLESINGVALDADGPGNTVPELDFGERMSVSGNTGCNRFSGHALLHEDGFQIEQIASTRMACPPAQMDIETTLLRVLQSESVIRLTVERQLTLESGDVLLIFGLRDWVN